MTDRRPQTWILTAEHWHLAFQGQLRRVAEHDADLVETRMREATAAGERGAAAAA